MKKNQIQRTFVKSKSVFAKWQEDTTHIIQECLDHDFRFIKLQKFIKN